MSEDFKVEIVNPEKSFLIKENVTEVVVPAFEGEMETITEEACDDGNANKIESEFIGVRDYEGKPVTVDQLMSDEKIDLHERSIGVLLPSQELLERIKYGWFVRMDIDQVLKSKTNIGRFLLKANCQ